MDASQTTAVTPAPAPASEATQNVAVNTPPVENTGSPAPASNDGRAIPYSRFQEVVSQKNEYASKLEAIERRLGAYESNLVQNRPASQVEAAISRLVAGGLQPEAAKLMVETQMALLDSRVNERLTPIEQRSQRQDVDGWVRGFAQDHADYRSLEPKMEQEFANLSPDEQRFVAGSPKGLEMLYWKVKGMVAQGQVQQGQVQGATQAYNNIAQKAAMSATPSASVGNANAITRESISKMTNEEYAKNRAAIFEAYKAGTIR